VDAYQRRFWNYLRWDGKTDRAERVITDTPLQDDPAVVFCRSFARYLNRDFRGALETLSPAANDAPLGPFRVAAKTLLECLYLGAAGDRTGVVRSCGTALSAIEKERVRNPTEAWLELGCAHALLEHRADAILAADRVKELSPLSADAYDGADSLLEQAQILARAGAAERAVGTLGQLLSIPSTVSVAWLRLDPCWDPLRDTPGFRALLERSAPPSAR
jgi:hypothetical protein